MDFKSLISQLDQLNEAETKTTKTGRVHKGDYGTEHQPEIERDDYGHRIPNTKKANKKDDAPEVKKGRGRPAKATQASGEDKKYDFSAFGVTKGKDVKLPKYDKKKTKKHSIKEYLDQMYKPLNEMGITVKPMPGASQIIGANGKPMGTADAATANVIKQASEKGTLKLGGEEGMKEGTVSDHPENQAKIQKQFSSIPGLMDVWKKYKHLGDYGTNLQTTMSAVKKEFPKMDPKTLQSISTSLIDDNDPYSSNSMDAAFYAAKEIQKYLAGSQQVNEKDIGKHNNATTGFDALVKKLTPKYGVEAAKRIAGSQLKKIREADQPPRDALASPLTLESKKKPDANKNGIPDYAEDGKGKNDLKKKKVKEGMEHKLKAAYHAGKAHGLTGGSHCGKNYEDLEEARQYHEGYKCGLDECYGQTPIQGYVGEESGADVVGTMAGYGAKEGQLAEAGGGYEKKTASEWLKDPRLETQVEMLQANGYFGDVPGKGIQQLSGHGPKDDQVQARNPMYFKEFLSSIMKKLGDNPITAKLQAGPAPAMEAEIDESPFSWAAKNTPKGSKFSLGGKEFVKNDAFAFEALEKQLNALLEDKEVTEGMTVSISKGQQGSPDSVSVSAQDAEADQLLNAIKQAGLGLFGGNEAMGQTSPEPMTVDNDGEPSEVGAAGDAIEVVGDHDGMMSLMKKLSGIGGGEHSHDEESEETCEACGGMMEEGHSCSKDEEMIDEVESEDQMTYQVAEDNPPDSGAAEVDAEDASVSAANAAAAAYNPSDDIDEGSEASPVANDGIEAGDAAEEMQASMNEEDADEKQKDGLDESSFFNLYKKLSMLSEESTSEKDDKAEKAAKKVAKDIEYDEGHKGKDDNKAEKAGKKVKKDIEYDDKKDDKKKVDEAYANSVDDTFETDIDFMMNVISGGLNKRKSTGQTTIPVVASQLNRTVSHNTKDINESSDSVSAWRKLAGIK